MYYVYITTNPGKTTFYTGFTNNIKRRMMEHREGKGIDDHFTGKYFCHKLVYYETFDKPMDGIRREKQIKKLSHLEKVALIKSQNPSMSFYNTYKINE